MRISVRQKLLFNSAVALALMLIVGVTGYVGIARVDDAKEQIAANFQILRLQMASAQMHDSLRADAFEAVIAGGQGAFGEKDRILAAIAQHESEMRRMIESAKQADIPAELKRRIEGIGPNVERYAASAKALANVAFTEYIRANEAMNTFAADFKELGAAMKALSDEIEKSTQVSQSAGGGTATVAKAVIALVFALAAVVLLAASYAIAHGILRPLRNAVAAAHAVADGDLTVAIESGSSDELGQLLEALRKMKNDLADAARAIQAAADNVGAGSREIARGNADLSSRTEEQASTLEETASSMEELTATVRQNADNARQANQLAIGASDVAARGGEVVHEVVTTMGGISEASRKIADIIAVIDGIAFQTNILALNAAVEAARAGEQGRGFAVVAAEVRSLAQRSATAAKEIKALIEDSASRVQNGAQLVDGAGKTMEEIVASVKRVTDIISEIAAASQEQLSGIEQVSRAIAQMDQVVQQNAALVEESAAAAENMAGQAETLVRAAARFKLDEAPRQTASARTVAQARAQQAPRVARTEKPAPAEPKPALPQPPNSKRAVPADRGSEGDWKEF
jgi:methyl-accepting chemotaxis protein